MVKTPYGNAMTNYDSIAAQIILHGFRITLILGFSVAHFLLFLSFGLARQIESRLPKNPRPKYVAEGYPASAERTQRAQYSFIKSYTVKYIREPTSVFGRFLN